MFPPVRNYCSRKALRLARGGHNIFCVGQTPSSAAGPLAGLGGFWAPGAGRTKIELRFFGGGSTISL